MNKIKRNDRVIVITEKTRERRVQLRGCSVTVGPTCQE